MTTLYQNNVEAETTQKKYYAYLNGKTQSAVFKSQQTKEFITVIDRVQFYLEQYCFYNNEKIDKDLYVTYRKTQVSIKIDKPRYRNRTVASEYWGMLELDGWTRKITPQGIIYVKKYA